MPDHHSGQASTCLADMSSMVSASAHTFSVSDVHGVSVAFDLQAVVSLMGSYIGRFVQAAVLIDGDDRHG